MEHLIQLLGDKSRAFAAVAAGAVQAAEKKGRIAEGAVGKLIAGVGQDAKAAEELAIRAGVVIESDAHNVVLLALHLLGQAAQATEGVVQQGATKVLTIPIQDDILYALEAVRSATSHAVSEVLSAGTPPEPSQQPPQAGGPEPPTSNASGPAADLANQSDVEASNESSANDTGQASDDPKPDHE